MPYIYAWRKVEKLKEKQFLLTILEILQNQVQIDHDNDDEDCYDGYGDNVDDFGDENYRTPEKYHDFLVKILKLSIGYWIRGYRLSNTL